MPLFAWDQVCKPISEGGLGIKKIRSMNKALLAKQGWRTYHDNKEWSTIWKHKYLFNVDYLPSSLLLMLFILLLYGELFRGQRKLLEKGVLGKLEMGIR